MSKLEGDISEAGLKKRQISTAAHVTFFHAVFRIGNCLDGPWTTDVLNPIRVEKNLVLNNRFLGRINCVQKPISTLRREPPPDHCTEP